MVMRDMALPVQGAGYPVDGCGVAPGLANLMAHRPLSDVLTLRQAFEAVCVGHPGTTLRATAAAVA
ncbi:hypothetical protein SAMN05216236_13342 [Sedimentitalea nanhaiensis]|uniref:Uncharacterized protein n=2 Tax=Sedimentitalea nanhaiensis TaxID=999627 RepID=A0A1I7DSB7_9RHOB|nr:hypothetical protein SAMN05216236_13342 [Sedimentitalea nanhaiensis]